MAWWYFKLTNNNRFWDTGYPIIDILWIFAFSCISMAVLICSKELGDKGLSVLGISILVLGVGIIIASICAVICRNYQYKEAKLKVDLECYKYERDMISKEENR